MEAMPCLYRALCLGADKRCLCGMVWNRPRGEMCCFPTARGQDRGRQAEPHSPTAQHSTELTPTEAPDAPTCQQPFSFPPSASRAERKYNVC